MKCLMNGMPVTEYNSPCGGCSLYLHTCRPVIFNGYLSGAECDLCACEWCGYYEECYTRNVTSCHSEQSYYESEGITNYEVNELQP